ncbi:MAG: FGGY-family carbohydrate kinase [Acidobacteriota bacterium]
MTALARERAVLALDLGTSACRGALYSSLGERLALASAEYPVHRPAAHFVEQDPRDYLEAARHVCRQLAQEGCEIAALGFSTQTPTLVFCNERGDAVAPAILWQDARGQEEARWLGENTDAARRAKWFGLDLPIGAAATPAKLLWMKRHRSEVWRATRWVVQPKDYVVAHLTGRFMTDHWCAKWIAHLASGEVHPEYLALLGKDVSPCPPAGSPAAVVGEVTPEAGAQWGLPSGVAVIVGWSDALAGVLATGALHHERRGFVLAGTSEIIGMSRRGGGQHPGLYRVPVGLLELHGLELHFGPTQAGGECLNWLARLFGKTHEEILDALDQRPGLGALLFRPYLHGERAPYWNHELCASLEGVRAEHGFADIVQAVLQGVALQERLVLECAEGGEPATEVVLAGGAARDPRWNRLRANILQRRLLVMHDMEASLRGIALLAWGARDPAPDWFAAGEVLPDRACEPLARELLDRFRLADRAPGGVIVR